jgi:hypothetical protein
MALTLAQVQSKVNSFVNKFNTKADQAALEDEVSAREDAVSNLTANVDPAALDSFAETVTEFATIRQQMTAADGSLEQATLALAQNSTTAINAVQSNLTGYISTNDARVTTLEDQVEYIAENLPQNGGSSHQA